MDDHCAVVGRATAKERRYQAIVSSFLTDVIKIKDYAGVSYWRRY